MRGLPSTGQWEVTSFGILRAKNTSLEYIEDRGYPAGSGYWNKTLQFQYGSSDSGFVLVISPTRIQSNYPQTAVVFSDGLTYNYSTKTCNFKINCFNCIAWFNWEIYETFRRKF